MKYYKRRMQREFIHVETSRLCAWALQMHSPCMSREVISVGSIFCPPLTSLAKQNWLPPQHRGHNLSADVLQLWAEQSVKGGDGGAALWLEYSPQMYEVIHMGTRANTYFWGEWCWGSVRLLRQTRQRSSQRNEERVGLGVVLYRHASVIIQWASRQRGCFFMKQPFPLCQASPWYKSSSRNQRMLHTSVFSQDNQIKNIFFLSVAFIFIYINVYKYKMSFTRVTHRHTTLTIKV